MLLGVVVITVLLYSSHLGESIIDITKVTQDKVLIMVDGTDGGVLRNWKG